MMHILSLSLRKRIRRQHQLILNRIGMKKNSVGFDISVVLLPFSSSIPVISVSLTVCCECILYLHTDSDWNVHCTHFCYTFFINVCLKRTWAVIKEIFSYFAHLSVCSILSKLMDLKPCSWGQNRNLFVSPFLTDSLKSLLPNKFLFFSFQWGSPSDETGKTEAPCHWRCGTIKIPPCSKALSAEHRPNFAALHQQWWRLHISKIFLSGT
jgi:hypothetical protein